MLTTKGQLYTGIIAYQSVDGMLLRTSLNETVRIEAHEMEFQRQRTISLMPRDLLRDLKDQDLADLYAYLKGLE